MHSDTHLAPETMDFRRRYLCRHIFTAGHRCASPALRGQDFCYYHRAARPPMALSGRTGMFAMPRIDDRAALQIALFEILSRITAGDIDPKRAATLLYGLSIASANLPPHPRAADAAPQAQLVEDIAHDFHLGDLAPIVEIPGESSSLSAPPIPASQIAPLQLSPATPSSSAGVAPGVGPQETSIASAGISASGTQLLSSPPRSLSEQLGGAMPPALPESAMKQTSNGPMPDAADEYPILAADGPLTPRARVRIPPSCFGPAPEIIPSHAAEAARIAEEVHAAVQDATHRSRPPITMQLSKQPSTDTELTTDALSG